MLKKYRLIDGRVLIIFALILNLFSGIAYAQDCSSDRDYELGLKHGLKMAPPCSKDLSSRGTSRKSGATISDAICGTWDSIMKGQTLGFRQLEIPLGTAEETYNSESDVRTRIFLKKVVRFIYSDPKKGSQYLETGKFFEDCVKTHRGF
jgi:hypothetical protein